MAQRVEEIKLSLIDGVSKGLAGVSESVEGVSSALDELKKEAADSQKSVSGATEEVAALGGSAKSATSEVEEFNEVLQRQVNRLKEQAIEAKGGAAALARYRLEQLDVAGASEEQRAAAQRLIAELEQQQRALDEVRAQTAAAAQAAKDFDRTLAKLSSAKTADEIDRLEREFISLKDGVGLSEIQIKRFADEMARARKAAADAQQALIDSAAAAEAIKRESALANSEVALFNRALQQQVNRLKEQAVEARGGAVALAQYRLEQLNQANATEDQKQAARQLIVELQKQEAALQALKDETAASAQAVKDFENALKRVSAAETADELNALEKEFADLAKRAGLSEEQISKFNGELNQARIAQQKAAAESQKLITGVERIRGALTGAGAAFVQFNAGLQIAQAGINAIAGAGRAFNGLIKGASDAQFQLAGLQAALGATPEELAKLDAEARRVSETLGLFTKTDVLNALGDLGRAGLSATQAMEALNPVLNLATGGQVDLAFATEVTVNTLTQFGLSIDQAAKLANGLVTAANSSTTNVNDLGLALSYAATQARAAGNDLETTLEILAALAQTGIQGERAGTALRTVFAALADSGSQFATSLRTNYGITTQNLVEVIERLRGSADGGKQALLALGIEARPAIQGLVQLAVPEFNKLRDSVALTGTAAEDATRLLTETYNAAAGRLVNILTNLRNELATPILAPLGDALENLAKRVSEFAKTEDFNLLKQAITDFATEAGAQLEQLIAEFDFKEASENAVAAFAIIREQLDLLKETFSNSAEVIGTVFNALEVSVRAIQTAFNAVVVAVTSVAVGFTDLSIAYAKLRGESQEVIDSLENLKQSLIQVGLARFDQTGESAAKLARSLGLVADEGRKAATGVKAAEEAAAKSTAEFERLEKAIREIKTRAELDKVTDDFRKFAGSTESSAEQVDKLEGSLNRASKEIRGTAQEVQRVTLFVKDADGEYKSLGKSVEDVGDKGQESGQKLGKAAREAADDTERLAQAFRDANSAGQFEGALDQFERLKASGRLTAEQIAEIEQAAQEAGQRFKQTGAEGEDAFQQIEQAADDAKDAVEGIGDAAEEQGRTLQDVFDQLAQAQEESLQRNEEIQRQIEDQRERSNDLLEKEIELLERKLSLSKEELGIADMLRQKYKLADQDRLDRYAQLIARQRELNREREEELRIIGISGGSAAGGGNVGGGNGPNSRPVGTGRPATGGAGDASGDVAQSAPLTARALARLLKPELDRLQVRGG